MLPRFLRGILPALLLTSLLAACGQVQTRASVEANARAVNAQMENRSVFGGLFQIARIPREVVPFTEKHPPGTIIVNTSQRRLYYVLGNGQALRYGIGVGRDGF